MVTSVNETVLGSLKALGIPQNACYEDFAQLLKDLPNWFTVEVPASVGNVVISVTEPGEDSKGKVWIRITGTGVFVAPYMFFNGSWKRIYDYAPGSVIWMAGNSSQVGAVGTDLEPFELVTATAPSSVPSNARTAIVAQYVQTSPVTTPVQYIYFAVVYVGY
jgi:hypothetical protein